MGLLKKADKIGLFVIVSSVVIGTALGAAVWDMNFWPTDAEEYYLPAATQLPQLKYVSEIHQSLDKSHVKWLHGKEMFVVNASLLQQLLRDTTTLRPLVLLCILAVCLSSILIYFTARFYWGRTVALLCYFLFSTSIWPYVYILFVKHQPLGLLYFLLAVVCVQAAGRKGIYRIGYLLAGICFGLSVYSSTTAALLGVYLAGALMIAHNETISNARDLMRVMGTLMVSGVLFLGGFAATVIYFNYPQVVANIKSYLDYVEISKSYNHFYYNQPVLIQWISHPEHGVRGGWLWVVKYFQLIMPVLFPMSLVCLVVLLGKSVFDIVRSRWAFALTAIGMIFLSASSPILAELKGVAQYGANYFTSLVGIIILVGYSVHLFLESAWLKKLSGGRQRGVVVGLMLLLSLHAVINICIFVTDVYPTRMCTTFLSRKIESLNVKEVSSYMTHPLRMYVVDSLSPRILSTVRFGMMDHIYQPPRGYILIPPVTGNSIYQAVHSSYNDYDKDIYFNTLLEKGLLEKYVIASYPTMATSRIWPHEEEILSYRYLILKQFSQEIIDKGKVWLLDAEKLQQDADSILPPPEYVESVVKDIRNIGTRKLIYKYDGIQWTTARLMIVPMFPAKLYKVGAPKDFLIAYVYKVEPEQKVWVPLCQDFISFPISAQEISSDPKGNFVNFKFPKSLNLEAGEYKFVVYRTGKPDDENYYSIYQNARY